MGSSASKAAQNTTRKFPSRASNFAAPSSTPSPRPPPAPRQNPLSKRGPSVKDESIRLDAMDPSPPTNNPAFADRLRQIGAVQPNPTLSHSSTFAQQGGGSPAAYNSRAAHPSIAQNTTLSALAARHRIQEQADREFADLGKGSFAGRELLDAAMIRDVLVMRSRGVAPEHIEKRLRLKPGVVRRLGPPGVVAALRAS
ncbi:hypothetical protein PspLS_01293 [Pyricularia sp. CBS 133598]|nr:hypothetical protein PspLS_01293 [Pyricularia sp. CBS 133598]